jgi:hypothetical protein
MNPGDGPSDDRRDGGDQVGANGRRLTGPAVSPYAARRRFAKRVVRPQLTTVDKG